MQPITIRPGLQASAIIARYLQHIHEFVCTAQRKNIKSALARLATMPTFDADAIETATQHLIDDTQLSTGYRRKCLAIIKRFAAWSLEHELLDRLPASPPGRLKPRENATQSNNLDPFDCYRFFELIKDDIPIMTKWVRDALRIIAYTGARPAEILALRTCDIDTRRTDSWITTPQNHKTANRGIHRVVVFSPPAITIIQRRLKPICPDDWLFPSLRSAERHTDPLQLSQHVRRKLAKCRRHKWTPYDLRRAAATMARDLGGLDNAQALLGHADARTTERHYARLNHTTAATSAALSIASEVQL